MASLLSTEKVNEFVRDLRAVGCVIERDDEAGKIRAKEGYRVVFLALQKGEGQPWVVRFTDGVEITWNQG